MIYRINRSKVRVVTEAEKEANRVAKEAKLRAQMTCQCCFRKHLANTGSVAHHGYQRPGFGWQTTSCSGAKFLPLEMSRDRLGWLITVLNNSIEQQTSARDAIKTETAAIINYINDMSKPRDHNGKYQSKTIVVEASNFEQVKAENASYWRQSNWQVPTWEEFKARELSKRSAQIKMTTDDRNNCQAIYDKWVQTHTWNRETKTWTKL